MDFGGRKTRKMDQLWMESCSARSLDLGGVERREESRVRHKRASVESKQVLKEAACQARAWGKLLLWRKDEEDEETGKA